MPNALPLLVVLLSLLCAPADGASPVRRPARSQRSQLARPVPARPSAVTPPAAHIEELEQEALVRAILDREGGPRPGRRLPLPAIMRLHSTNPLVDSPRLERLRPQLQARATALSWRERPPRPHPQAAKFDIPVIEHPLVDMYVRYFAGRGRDHFAVWLARLARYQPTMEKILVAQGVPKDLVYLAMIESGFSAQAYSSAAAVGYWQFMDGTGSVFGLRHDVWMDERRDFVRSTEAAATYLHQLYGQLGDWHLAWASYNGGLTRVRRAMQKHNADTFWQLIRHKNSLATETTHYVPKIMAAAIIGKDPAAYGFDRVVPMAALAYDEVTVRQATDLRALARDLNVPLTALRELNPALLVSITPPRTRLRLRVPVGRAEEASALLRSQPVYERWAIHQIRRGDTLTALAQRYRVPLAVLHGLNENLGRRLRVGEQLLVPSGAISPSTAVAAAVPARGLASAVPIRPSLPVPRKLTTTARRQTRQAGSASVGRGVVVAASVVSKTQHKVGTGDTLWSIARLYGVSVRRLKACNARAHNRLSVGEVLRVF